MTAPSELEKQVVNTFLQNTGHNPLHPNAHGSYETVKLAQMDKIPPPAATAASSAATTSVIGPSSTFDPFIPGSSPSVGMLVLTGKSAPNTERYKRTDFIDWNYGLPVKNCYNLMWAVNGVPRKNPVTKQTQYHWFGFGGFSTFTAASTWALNTAWIDHQAQISINTAMKILAYGCLKTVPCGRPRWELPCFRTDDKEPDWTLEKEMESHVLPFSAPDPTVHFFEDIPTLLGVDAYEVNDSSVQEWYNDFLDLYPELITARSFVQSEPLTFSSAISAPAAAAAAASAAATVISAVPIETKMMNQTSASSSSSSRIQVTPEVRLLCPQRVEPPRGRGRPRKGSQPIRHPFEIAMAAKREKNGPEPVPIATLDEMDVDEEEGEDIDKKPAAK